MIHKICLTHERSSLCKRFKVIKTISSKSFFCQKNSKFFSQQIIILSSIRTLKTVKCFGSSIRPCVSIRLSEIRVISWNYTGKVESRKTNSSVHFRHLSKRRKSVIFGKSRKFRYNFRNFWPFFRLIFDQKRQFWTFARRIVSKMYRNMLKMSKMYRNFWLRQSIFDNSGIIFDIFDFFRLIPKFR